MKKWIFGTPVDGILPSIGLLLNRLIFGGFMLYGHGWSKLMSFSEQASNFPDPLGIGSTASMAAAIFGEVVCSALMVLGVATRISALPLIFTMGVAAFIVHADAALFTTTKELALLYLTAGALLFFTGAGRFSIDGIISRKG